MLFTTVIEILQILLDVIWWIIVVQWVLSLLIMFNVINTYSPFVRQTVAALDQMTEPLYRPIRRIMPDFGGLDFSPAIVLLVISILSRVVLPNLMVSAAAHGMIG